MAARFQIGDRVRLRHQISRDFTVDRRQRGTVIGYGDYAGLVLFVSFDRIRAQRSFVPTRTVCVSADDIRLW